MIIKIGCYTFHLNAPGHGLEDCWPLKKARGSVTIPGTIGDRSFKKALIDLGASVSLMPLSIYKILGIGKVQDTRMTLQFADQSMKKPYGVVKDVLVKIDKFVFPVDFVILE